MSKIITQVVFNSTGHLDYVVIDNNPHYLITLGYMRAVFISRDDIQKMLAPSIKAHEEQRNKS